MKSLIIVENTQSHFDFSKTTKEHQATKNVVNQHEQDMRNYYGSNIYNRYKNKIFNTNPVLREELVAKYKKYKNQLNKQRGVKTFNPNI